MFPKLSGAPIRGQYIQRRRCIVAVGSSSNELLGCPEPFRRRHWHPFHPTMGVSVPKVRFKGEQRYLPFPHIHHVAQSLRRSARTTEVGRYHLEAAALVMTAFAVEAFCQSLGPDVLGAAWTTSPDSKKPPIERWSLKDKLKAIGKAVNEPVDFGQKPWSLISDLMNARDELAHGRHLSSERTTINWTLDVPDGADPYDVLRGHLRDSLFPLHQIDRLEAVTKEIDAGLLRLWVSAGNPDYTFDQTGMTSWSAVAV